MNQSKKTVSMVGRNPDKPYSKRQVLEKLQYTEVCEYKGHDGWWKPIKWPTVFILTGAALYFTLYIPIPPLAVAFFLFAYIATGWFRSVRD